MNFTHDYPTELAVPTFQSETSSMRDGRRLSIGVGSGQGRMIYGTKRDCTEVSWDLSLQPLRDLVWNIVAGMEHVDQFSRCEG